MARIRTYALQFHRATWLRGDPLVTLRRSPPIWASEGLREDESTARTAAFKS